MGSHTSLYRTHRAKWFTKKQPGALAHVHDVWEAAERFAYFETTFVGTDVGNLGGVGVARLDVKIAWRLPGEVVALGDVSWVVGVRGWGFDIERYDWL